jgi:hypothetical protein
MSLDPSTFVNTSNWTSELGLQSLTPAAQPNVSRTRTSASKPPPNRKGQDVESLEQMLEPERTGVHKKGESKPPWALIIIVMLLLAAGAAVAVVVAMQ